MSKFLIIYLLSTIYFLLSNSAAYAAAAPPTICDLESVFSGVLRVALGFAGLAVFVMFILSGYKWLTAGTNEKAVQEARKGFTLAIAGLALIFAAWFILLFIQNFTGIDVTIFRIPGC
jgi:hypothetical protein